GVSVDSVTAADWPSGERGIWCWSCPADTCVSINLGRGGGRARNGGRLPGLAEPAEPDVLLRPAVGRPADAAPSPGGQVAFGHLGRIRPPRRFGRTRVARSGGV